MNAIEIQNLARRFGRTTAIEDLSLTVPEGSVFALLGPNGAGKTTTIKILMNFIPPTSGRAMVRGVDSRKLGPKERSQIGYVSENQILPLWMTVRRLLDYCRPFYPTWDRELEGTLLRQFDLPEDRRLKDLSRGMLMKAALLCALAYRPRLLVLDEPFSGLDPIMRDEFVHGILEATELGNWTVFISSHDIEEVERLADHIGLIDRGRTKLNESAESLLTRFRRFEVILPGSSASLRDLPPAWLLPDQVGERMVFVDSQYAPTTTEKACQQRFPGAVVSSAPMSLREIFITLSRTSRKTPNGTAL
ncbi:MAG: ABC transporter ATP-binding protein [Opitutaceae bacterium]